MRILFVSQMIPYLPCRDGFRVIPANLLLELSRIHDIHLVALSNGSEAESERRWCEPVCRSVDIVPQAGELSLTRRRGERPGTILEEMVVKRVDQLRPDVLHVEGAALAAVARLVSSPTFKLLSAHDSLQLRFLEFARWGTLWTRARASVLAHVARRFEERWFRGFDHVVVTSEADRNAVAKSSSPAAVTVIPNGVDLQFFQYNPQPHKGNLVFTGNMSWPPNEDGACFFAKEILPRVRRLHDGVRLFVVGADPTARVRALSTIPGVSVTGSVEDIRPWVWKAEVYVSPLRFGAGVKNKILEAMALGTPVVGTRESFTGTPVVNGEQARVVASSVEFAEVVAGLLRDGEARRKLASAGRKFVETHYTWASVARRFEGCYSNSAAAHSRNTAAD